MRGSERETKQGMLKHGTPNAGEATVGPCFSMRSDIECGRSLPHGRGSVGGRVFTAGKAG